MDKRYQALGVGDWPEARKQVKLPLLKFNLPDGERRVRVLLQDAASPQRSGAPLLPLAQRLPSVFAFREVRDPVDARYPSAYAFNDTGGALLRPLGHRFDGETGHDAPAPRGFLAGLFGR